jgi:hypothetical protein
MDHSRRYLQWSIAPGEIEPHDPLGDFRVDGDEGTLLERETYVDAYMLALLDGLEALREAERATIDTVIEPWPIELEWDGGHVLLRYRGTTIRIFDPGSLERELREGARELIGLLDRAADEAGLPHPVLPELRAAGQRT